jgi:hypothetical protein
MANFADIRNELPPSVRGRFDSLGSFVNTVIRDIEDRRQLAESRRLPKEVRQDISLLVFVAGLRQFLMEGSRAATAAANEVASFEFSGFSIGNYVFTPDNENTRRGAVLAEELWARIEDHRLKNLLGSERSLSKLVEELYAVARNPERLDRYHQAAGRPD